MTKMRTMTHHGRGKGRAGHTFGTRHNDRSFDIQNARNIDAGLTPENLVWHYYMDDSEVSEESSLTEEKALETLYAPLNWRLQGMLDQAQGTDYAAQDKARYFAEKRAQGIPEPTVEIKKDMTFDDVETRFYQEHFADQLQRTNQGYIKNGHPERCKDMASWKQARRNAPTESIYQIGDKHVTGNYVDAATLKSCYDEFARAEQEWNKEHGNPFTVLNRALHQDEPNCPPHIHERRVWHYHAEDGSLRLGQEKALEQAGIDLPDPTKKVSRYNNRKIAYDTMMREKWLDILERHGVQIEREPVPGSKGKPSKDKEQYVREKYETMVLQAAAAKEEAEKQRQRADDQEERCNQLTLICDYNEMVIKEQEERIAELSKIVEERNNLIQVQTEVLDLIWDYQGYLQENELVNVNLQEAEDFLRGLPEAKKVFRSSADKMIEWFMARLSEIQKTVDACLQRMRIYEKDTMMDELEKLSKAAQERVEALDNKISAAFGKTALNAPGSRQSRQREEDR